MAVSRPIETHAGAERYAIDPVGIGIALLGALAMFVGVFLPQLESSTFIGGIQENTLVQDGDGYIFIGLAIGVTASTYRSWKNGTRPWAVLVLGLIAMGLAIYHGTAHDQTTLYSIGSDGNPDPTTDGVTAKPGIGIYMVGIGGLLALVGGWRMRSESDLVSSSRQGQQVAPPITMLPPAGSGAVAANGAASATKQCPDCAETILAAARVCRYCGYRFADGTDDIPTQQAVLELETARAVARTLVQRGVPRDQVLLELAADFPGVDPLSILDGVVE